MRPASGPPTFSVIIAAYQAADVVADAIESALGQTAPPLEVVVCDDGSTDDIGAALAPFLDRVEVVRKRNGGEASAKNAAARAASGDFVVILDADDVYLPERLEALAELAVSRPDLDILTTDAYLEAQGRILRRAYTDDWRFAAEGQRTAILERNFIFGHAAVRRELLLAAGGFDEGILRTTDWDCWARLLLGGATAGAVLEPLSMYKVRATSLSADRAGMLEGGLQTLNKALGHPRLNAGERLQAERTIARFERELELIELRQALASGGPDVRARAARVARRSTEPAPTRLKAAAAWVAPTLVARVLRRRGRDSWIGAGGTRVDSS